MALCYFNFRQGTVFSVDELGCDFASVEDAYLGAVRAAQEMWSELLQRREDPLLCTFEVTDAKGRELFCLPFSEVLEVCSGRRVAPSSPAENPLTRSLENRRAATRAMASMSLALRDANATLRETMGLLAQVQKAVDS